MTAITSPSHGESHTSTPTPTTTVSAFTTRKIPENMTNQRIVVRSEVARDSSWPDGPAVVEGDRQPLQVRVQVGAHGGLDLVGGARDEQPPQQDQPGFECTERQHAEHEPGEGVELAARDRAVDDRAGDERDRQPREGGGERGDTAADQGGAVRDGRRAADDAARAGVGRRADRLP